MRRIFTFDLIKKVFVLMVCAVFGGLNSGMTYSATPTESDKKPIFVFVEEAKKNELFDTLSFPAKVQPKINANVLAETDGVLIGLLAPIGQVVKKGTILAKVKNMDPIYDYAPAKVLAPVKGVVSSIETSEGSYVTRGQKIMTITDPTQFTILIEVAQMDLKHVSVGLNGTFTQSGSKEGTPVSVSGVSPFVDSITGTATAELKTVSLQQSMPIVGVLGQVSFKVNSKSGFELPENAIVYRSKNPFVRLVKEGIAKYVPVELGETRKGKVEILKGFAEGDKIILRSSQFISEGDPVIVKEAEEPKL